MALSPTISRRRARTLSGTEYRSAAVSEHGFDKLHHLRRIPGLGRDELLDHLAVLVNQIAFRILDGAVGEIDFLVGIARGLVRERKALQEVLIRVLVFIDADAEHYQSYGRELAGHLDARGNFVEAGDAPGGPEIQEQQLAAEIARGVSAAGIGSDGEIGSGVAGVHDDFVKRVIKGAAKRHHHQRERDRENTISFHSVCTNRLFYNSSGLGALSAG